MTEENFEDYVHINRMYLSLLGLWPLQKDASSYRNYIDKFHSKLIIMLLCIFFVFPMILDLYIVWGNINAMVENLSCSVHGIFVILKFVHVRSNRQVFTELLSLMKHNFESSLAASSTTKSQKTIIYEQANFARTVTKYFIVSLYYIDVSLFLLPFLYGIDTDPVRYKRYPFCAWYYYDQHSRIIYAFCYGIQTIPTAMQFFIQFKKSTFL